jgi:hypothetical protein
MTKSDIELIGEKVSSRKKDSNSPLQFAKEYSNFDIVKTTVENL